MPTENGFFDVAGEIVFPDEDACSQWLAHVLGSDDSGELVGVYSKRDVPPISPEDAFDGIVATRREGASFRFRGHPRDDPKGTITLPIATACVAAVKFGGEGAAFFLGDPENDFVIRLDGEEYELEEADPEIAAEDPSFLRADEISND